MSGRLFKRRCTSSAMSAQPQQQGLPFANDDVTVVGVDGATGSDTDTQRPSAVPTRRVASASSAGLSSSYSLPARSYIHHASHGSQEPVHYSSSGVREQTAELSSSFLGDSKMTRSLSHSPPRRSAPVSPDIAGTEKPADYLYARRHDPIKEQSEPATPDEATSPSQEHPQPSHLTAMLKRTSEHFPHLHLPEDRSQDEQHGHGSSSPITEVAVEDEEVDDNILPATERTPLLPRERLSSVRKQTYDGSVDVEQQHPTRTGSRRRLGHMYPFFRRICSKTYRVARNPKSWDMKKVADLIVVKPVKTLPAVFLGLLLNLLDALSYGIILFPLGEEVFSKLGPDGVSMFYVSCIISQLVYSTGSIFRGGVGSEMIEVVPFFHKMTYMIMGEMGVDRPDALRATVITSYAMSSILTGIVFFALGSFNLGTLVNFFPHSILTGCIGGVGIFLFVTGLEVSARLDGNLEFSMEVLLKLFSPDTLPLWLPPLALAIILLTVKHFYDRPWLVPAYYIGITAIFYIVTVAVPDLNMEILRDHGWVFEAPAAGVPFYNFYSYYKFGLVDWGAIWLTVPTQFALTFFGILHVPINVPNLAMVVQEDNVSVNRELIMHGISNTLSGCAGSIQNYLVFVNSVLFIHTGGDSRLAGYMLAGATFGLWVAGPVIIGYVPVMVVGTLIYMLGIDLAMEALVGTYGRLHRLEYFTIVVIAIVMGIYDFVVGIAVGIGLACLVYVVQTSRKTVIRAEFSGTVAESTVRRHPRQRKYLHKVGPQIRVVKLGGYLFFGSIVNVEKKVRALIDAEAFAASPIRYLILDFSHVTGIDFSAAEAFGRMNRILHRREVKMTLAGVSLDADVGKSLRMVGLFVEDSDDAAIPAPKIFEDLNGALESCENEMLLILTEKQRSGDSSPPVAVPSDNKPLTSGSPFDGLVGSPRRDHLYRAAERTITESSSAETAKWQHFKQPLPLILQAFQDITAKNEDFWYRAVPFFTRREYSPGQILYSRGDTPDGFYLLQSGILRAEYFLEQGAYHESIVAGTTCGELPFFSDTERTSSVVAERRCVAWLLTREMWEELQREDGDVARELLTLGLKLSAERMNAITSYVLITAS